MKIVVDSNIVFSALLNSQGKIGNIIINGNKYFEFHTIGHLNVEIFNHQKKIMEISGLNQAQFNRSFKVITDRITFVDEILLSDEDISKATSLVRGIDEDDTLFVALANHLKSKLWTGDKKLINGLHKKGFSRLLTTDELFDLFLNKELENLKRQRR